VLRWHLREKEALARVDALNLIRSQMPPRSELSKMEAIAKKYDLVISSSGNNEAKRRDLVGQYVFKQVLGAREEFCRERNKQFLLENSAPYRLLYWFYYSVTQTNFEKN
jgi:hypothetical protein